MKRKSTIVNAFYQDRAEKIALIFLFAIAIKSFYIL